MDEWLARLIIGLITTGVGGGGASIYLLFRQRGREPLEQSGLSATVSLTEAEAMHEAEKAFDLRHSRWEKDWTRQDARLDVLEGRNDKLEERVADLAADLDVAVRDKTRLRRGLSVTIHFVEVLAPLVDDLPPYPEGWDNIKKMLKP